MSKSKKPRPKPVDTYPAQCPSCGGRLKKRGGAYKVQELDRIGLKVKWFFAQCGSCKQRARIREHWKPTETEAN